MLWLILCSVPNVCCSQGAANENRRRDKVYRAPVRLLANYNHGTSTAAIEEPRDIPQPPSTARIPCVGDLLTYYIPVHLSAIPGYRMFERQ